MTHPRDLQDAIRQAAARQQATQDAARAHAAEMAAQRAEQAGQDQEVTDGDIAHP